MSNLQPLIGRWRIVEMSDWDPEDIDLEEPGFIEFFDNGTGQFHFITVQGWLDCRPAERSERPGIEFTWEGAEEGDQVSGRGWAALTEHRTLEGHVYIHLGEDSTFLAEPDVPDRAV